MKQVVRLVDIDCPDCGNVSRRARRSCKGMCRGTGKTTKYLPVWVDDDEPDVEVAD